MGAYSTHHPPGAQPSAFKMMRYCLLSVLKAQLIFLSFNTKNGLWVSGTVLKMLLLVSKMMLIARYDSDLASLSKQQPWVSQKF